MSKSINFGPIVAVKMYDSEFSDKFRFIYVSQKTETVYVSGADDTYEGTSTPFDSSRNCFTKWAIGKSLEEFQKDVLKGRGAGRIISIIGCDLFSILSEDQASYLKKLVDEKKHEQAEEMLANWAENMLKLDSDGEPLEYRGLQMFGRYAYRRDSKAEDIDLRSTDYDAIMARRELEDQTPEVVEEPVEVPSEVSLVDSLG